MKVFRERPGIISPNSIWVGFGCGPYMYTHSRLIGLLWLMLTEWKDDKHLVG